MMQLKLETTILNYSIILLKLTPLRPGARGTPLTSLSFSFLTYQIRIIIVAA